MKILLCAVNTKYIHSNAAVRLLKAYAGNADADIEIAEFTINNRSSEILEGIYKKSPDVVMFSCYIWNIAAISDILEDLSQLLPGIPVWLGGPEVSFDPENELKKHPSVTGIILGEGEKTFKDLADHYAGNSIAPALSDIPGICFRQDENTVRTSQRELMDMDEVPFIYNDDNIHEFDNKIIYYETSRGCPFGCSYCLSSVDKKVRFRSLGKVYSELQFFLDHRVKQVKFVDRTFNVDHRHSMGILTYILEHDNGITNFHFEIAGDLLTEEEIRVMSGMRPGLIQLEIGVQSVNPCTIRAINRIMDLERLKKNTALIRSFHNIHQHLDLIAGLPYEDFDSFAKSFDEVYAMKPDQLQLGFLKVLKGSPMETAAAEYGIRYMTRSPYEVISTDWLSFDDILRLKKIEEMVEIYYNSMQFTRTLVLLESCFDSPFEMYEKMAGFYEDKGYFFNSPARVYRYNILLDFAKSVDPDREEIYKELLTFDLYLRENMKSRPLFSPDLSKHKEMIREMHIEKSLHPEVFKYNILAEDPAEMKTEFNIPAVIVFDHSRRDPLNGNAYYEIRKM